MTHYSQREASYPLLKQVVLENLRKMKTEKNDEYNRVKSSRVFSLHQSSCENLGQHFNSGFTL